MRLYNSGFHRVLDESNASPSPEEIELLMKVHELEKKNFGHSLGFGGDFRVYGSTQQERVKNLRSKILELEKMNDKRTIY